MPEMVEEKQVQPSPAPVPAPRGRFAKILRAWIAASAFFWAATLCHALSQISALGADLARLPVPIRGGALAIGAAVGIALVVIALKKLGGQLEYFKPGQGTWVRASSYGAVAAMLLFGCVAFYRIPALSSSWWTDLARWPVFGVVFRVKPILFPTAGIFLTAMFVVFLLLNRGKWADFLIETEGELKKVSWPPRKEFTGSAFVVLLVVVVISMFLFGVDHGLSWLMKYLGLGF